MKGHINPFALTEGVPPAEPDDAGHQARSDGRVASV